MGWRQNVRDSEDLRKGFVWFHRSVQLARAILSLLLTKSSHEDAGWFASAIKFVKCEILYPLLQILEMPLAKLFSFLKICIGFLEDIAFIRQSFAIFLDQTFFFLVIRGLCSEEICVESKIIVLWSLLPKGSFVISPNLWLIILEISGLLCWVFFWGWGLLRCHIFGGF